MDFFWNLLCRLWVPLKFTTRSIKTLDPFSRGVPIVKYLGSFSAHFSWFQWPRLIYVWLFQPFQSSSKPIFVQPQHTQRLTQSLQVYLKVGQNLQYGALGSPWVYQGCTKDLCCQHLLKSAKMDWKWPYFTMGTHLENEARVSILIVAYFMSTQILHNEFQKKKSINVY